MKLDKTLLIGFATVTTLASCVSENLSMDFDKKVEQGRMLLNVTAALPQSTRAHSSEELANYNKVDNYPVDIYSSKDAETPVQHYDRVDRFPTDGLLMEVGEYNVISYTPIELKKKMTEAYYKGSETVTLANENGVPVTTDVDVVCKMQNSLIQVIYTTDFQNLFSSWSITIDDGSVKNGTATTALAFTDEDGVEPDPVYWLFDEGVEELTIKFQAKLKNGDPVSDSKSLTKNSFKRPYPEDDSNTFTGGDQLIFTFHPDDATTGDITGITISAAVTFAETDETEIVYLTDKNLIDDGGDDPNPGGDPTGEGPTLECDGGWEVSLDANPESSIPQTKVVVKTPEGLKSMKVTVTGGNEGFTSVTGFLNKLEMVDNTEDFDDIFDGVEDADVPHNGDLTYSFPVYAFYKQIKMFGATDEGKSHEFFMEVEDEKGNKANATLKIKVTENGGAPTSDTPILECEGGWAVTLDAAPQSSTPQTKVIVTAPKGIKSMKVTVTGGNEGFTSVTGFLNKLEMVDNTEDFEDIFFDVDGADVPHNGDLSYSFPVYAFYKQIKMFGATDEGKSHEFYMEVEDLDGNKANATLKVTVTATE